MLYAIRIIVTRLFLLTETYFAFPAANIVHDVARREWWIQNDAIHLETGKLANTEKKTVKARPP